MTPIEWLKTRVRTPWDGVWMSWTALVVVFCISTIVSLVAAKEGPSALFMVVFTCLLVICNFQHLEIKYLSGRGVR